MDKSRYVGAPSVEEVAIYCKESGYTIDPVAFVKWNSDRGWMNGKKYFALDWRKAVRKWFCKENGLSYSEMESMTDICHDMLSKVTGAQDEASHTLTNQKGSGNSRLCRTVDATSPTSKISVLAF